jgi:hypothetical protein
MDIHTDRLILIVTGAHLRAEATDRPIAYGLRQRLADWLAARGRPETTKTPRVLVCSDVWYLNNDPLRSRPTISIGGPGVNALSAYLADKLPSAFAVEDVMLVQADPEFHDAVACCWGRDEQATAAAVEAFAERYLEGFMEAATRS